MSEEDTAPEQAKRKPGRPKGYSPLKDKAPNSGPKVSWASANAIEDSLNATIKGIALGVELLNKEDGATIAKGGPALAKAMVDLARNDPRYRKYLETMSAPGKWGPLVMSVGAIALPIAFNHNLFTPKPKKVAPTPDPLSAEVQVTPPENIVSEDVPTPNFSGDSDNLGFTDPLLDADLYQSLGE